MLKILVTGSREWQEDPRVDGDPTWMFQRGMAQLLGMRDLWDPEYGVPVNTNSVGGLKLIVGDCPSGLDAIARDWCANNFVPYDEHVARWDLNGKYAGPLRNREMVRTRPDATIGWWKPDSPNKGGMGCVELSLAAGIPTFIYLGRIGLVRLEVPESW
jgi:hypothetical protein